MREDFVSRLGTQLFEAAERQERRGSARRAAAAVRWNATSAPVLAVCGVLLLAVLAVAAALALRGDEPPPVTGPRVVGKTQLVQTGGLVVPGFGAVWAVDAGTGEVLRVDPRTRRATARVPIGGQPSVDVVGGAVWAHTGTHLVRIDPDTNRVTARIELRARPAVASVVLPGRGGAVWVPSQTELLRIDPRRRVVDKRIALAGDGFFAFTAVSDGETLFVGRTDGGLLRFDARTGARVDGARPEVAAELFAARDGALFGATDTGVGAMDAATGRTLWGRELPWRTANGAVLAGGTVWAQGPDERSGRDRLWQLDARTGAIRASLSLPEFGAAGLAVVGDQVWVVSDSGVLVVVE
jgi:outer membrane protein assembly factor BamB